MDVVIHGDPIRVRRPVTMVLEDKGGAHVSIVVGIADMPPFRHDETFEGSRTVVVPFDQAGTYECNVLIAAYKYKALGPTYDASVTVNGVLVASAVGSIESSESSDFGFAIFSMDVT